MSLTKTPNSMLESLPYVMRNRVINGAMKIDQRNSAASKTFTAAAALSYCVDRWYGYCTGANITGQQVALANAQSRYRFTGAASNTGVGFGQRIEAANSMDMAGQTAMLQVKLSSSSLTTINWQAYYANTADTFGTLASPTRTSIASGSFTITSSEATYSTQIALPAGATTGIEIVFTGGALLGSQTLTIGDVQFELGSVASPFEQRFVGHELALCRAYCAKIGGDSSAHDLGNGVHTSTTNARCFVPFSMQMRDIPSLSFVGGSANFSSILGGGTYTGTGLAVGAVSRTGATVDLTISGATSGNPCLLRATATSAYILASAEL